MREILFRGKRIDNGEWVYGCPLVTEMSGVFMVGAYMEPKRDLKTGDMVMRDKLWQCEVDPSTIGQFTGLRDKNGKRIWEGDVVRHEDGSTGYIIFLAQTMSYRLVLPETDIAIGHRGMGGGYNHAPMLEVIGTIYDKEAQHERD